MLYFKVENWGGDLKVLEAGEDRFDGTERDNVIYRGDIKSFDQAKELAEAAQRDLGEVFLACDHGPSCSPRYDVIKFPKIGDPVSYGFNGDYYPDGHITKIGGTNCSRVYTDTGSVYNRYRKSSSWIKRGGTWQLVRGHVDERNPCF